MTASITGFLLARIAEDEAKVAAMRADAVPYGADPIGWQRMGGYLRPEQRWARECEAKRRLVALHPFETKNILYGLYWRDTTGCVACGGDDDGDPMPTDGPCGTMLALATVYSDHPNYRQTWAHT
jgi:hypothetical protein